VKAVELLRITKASTDHQWAISTFVDEFRRSTREPRNEMVREPIEEIGPLEGLVAAIVSALCREVGMEAPGWVSVVYSPDPFFAFPARSFALRLRLMIESPPPFRIRNVLVPENYLSRA
jgi:hypothetical protein